MERFNRLRGFEQKAREAKEYQTKHEREERLRINKTFSPRIEKVCKDFCKALGWRCGSGDNDPKEYGNWFSLSNRKMDMAIHVSIEFRGRGSLYFTGISVETLEQKYSDDAPHGVRYNDITFDNFSEEWLAEALEGCYKALLKKLY